MSTPFIVGPGQIQELPITSEQQAVDMAFLRDKRSLLANPG